MIKNTKKTGGFTIFFAVLIASLSLSVGLAIYDLLIRELALSQTATQSQYAIYAADTGVECALYWDFKCSPTDCPEGDGSAFATSTASVNPTSAVMCMGQNIVTDPPAWTVAPTATAATTTFTISFSPAHPYCAIVTVAKSIAGTAAKTQITSDGYNTCVAGALKVERTLRVTYQQ